MYGLLQWNRWSWSYVYKIAGSWFGNYIFILKTKKMEKVSSLKDIVNQGLILGPEESGIRKVIEKKPLFPMEYFLTM